MAGNVLEFTDANFQTEVLESSQPVLVDFWATWCGPCRAIAPAIEEIANEYAGKARVGKVNVDENPKTAMAHNIGGIPTILVFKQGRVVENFVGGRPKEQFTSALDRHLD